MKKMMLILHFHYLKILMNIMNGPRRKQRGIVRSPVELHSGFNTLKSAPRGGVLNPSARITNRVIKQV